MTRDEWKQIWPIINEWVINEDVDLYCGQVLLNDDIKFNSDFRLYKIKHKPKQILVNGILCAAPETKHPSEGTTCYLPVLYSDDKYDAIVCTKDSEFLIITWLNEGFIYLNKEDAVQRANAMVKFVEVVG